MYSKLVSTLLGRPKHKNDKSIQDDKKISADLTNCSQWSDDSQPANILPHHLTGSTSSAHMSSASSSSSTSTSADSAHRRCCHCGAEGGVASLGGTTANTRISTYSTGTSTSSSSPQPNLIGGGIGETFANVQPYSSLYESSSSSDVLTSNTNIPTSIFRHLNPVAVATTDNQSEIMGPYHKEYLIKWNVKYMGSFPISNTSMEHLSYRLEKFSPCNIVDASLSVSMSGVKVHYREDLLIGHSMRRILSVVGRPAMKEVAYIAMESSGQTYRKKCHVFRCHDLQDVEEIESVIGSAFHAALLATRGAPLPSMAASATMLAPTAMAQSKSVRTLLTSTPHIPAGTMSEKRASSTAFLSRLMGKGRDSIVEDSAKSKRKRRPVSAVFSAFQRLSSTATLSQKRMSAYEPTVHDGRRPMTRVNASPVPEEPIPPTTSEDNHRHSKIVDTPPALIFDEKLGEMIYPIGESLQAQLENVNYFVKLPTRELLVRNLLSHPEGAFVVRYSESKKRCLALSVRVPQNYNASGIAHYLIIRNEDGYRIKGFNKNFASLQMLVTHYSVLQEQLPVPLHFVAWNKDDWKTVTYDMPTEHKEKRHPSTIRQVPEIDENRNTKYFNDIDWVTPKRSSRNFEKRYSRLFDIDG
ncbi:unnamed protein product [Auanema sp. JU1783]|nr:unnamed protein product [Auanema sp. JU1783]